MEDKPFRVLLDFSEVNTGISVLKYVWMQVSPRELNTVYDFKQAIIRKFSFSQENFKLFVEGGLLLETEKIVILRENDTVKIRLEAAGETSMEYSASNSRTNISVDENSSPSVSSNAVYLKKSRKRKNDTFFTSKENECDSANSSKKKKKQDKTDCISDKSNNISTEDCLMNVAQEEPSVLDQMSKSSTICSHSKSSKKRVKIKKKPFPKTPTSDFINFAIKLSEAERNDHTNINVADSKTPICSASSYNLYKTAEIGSKTNLSPIPEKSTLELSSSKTHLDLTESIESCKSKPDVHSLTVVEVSDEKSSRKRKRRKRKRKASPAEDLCLSTDVNTEMGESFADVKSNETYNTSADTRKHIIFHSPSPPKISTTITLDADLSSSSDEPEELTKENNNLKSTTDLDRFKNMPLKEETEFDVKLHKDVESVVNETGDFTKESTPFSKKKLKGKSWGLTPLPRISTSSHTLSMESSDISKSDVAKPVYEDCTPINCLPPVGTRLVYKTLELNEDYCPEVTEYKEGILRRIDPNTDELEIELIQEEIKPGRSGKFENLWKDELPPDDQVVKTVSLNWSALIDPRLIP